MKMLIALAAIVAVGGPAAAQAQNSMAPMSGMDHAAKTSGAEGVGVVKKIDAAGGAITLQHGPIKALGWPAMTMSFKAAPDLLKGVQTGEKVTFTVKSDGTPELVAIHSN
jgi:Cu(I)/Ag(I) efflux system protein CusF